MSLPIFAIIVLTGAPTFFFQIEKLPDILNGISLRTQRFLLGNLARVRPFYQYLDPKEPYRVDNAVSLLMFSLWDRKHNLL